VSSSEQPVVVQPSRPEAGDAAAAVGGYDGEAAGYDADQVAAAARQQDPGLPPETAAMLAGQAWPLLQELGELDAPALARSLMTAGGVGATPANVVATAAIAFCETRGLLR